MKALPEHDLPAITVDLGAAYVHGCHTFNVHVIAQENKIVDRGRVQRRWGENAPWYDITKGGRIKERAVKMRFASFERSKNACFQRRARTRVAASRRRLGKRENENEVVIYTAQTASEMHRI